MFEEEDTISDQTKTKNCKTKRKSISVRLGLKQRANAMIDQRGGGGAQSGAMPQAEVTAGGFER